MVETAPPMLAVGFALRHRDIRPAHRLTGHSLRVRGNQAVIAIILLPSARSSQISIIGFDGHIELEALRHDGLPKAAPAQLCAQAPAPPVGQREFAAEVAWDLPTPKDPGPATDAAMTRFLRGL